MTIRKPVSIQGSEARSVDEAAATDLALDSSISYQELDSYGRVGRRAQELRDEKAEEEVAEAERREFMAEVRAILSDLSEETLRLSMQKDHFGALTSPNSMNLPTDEARRLFREELNRRQWNQQTPATKAAKPARRTTTAHQGGSVWERLNETVEVPLIGQVTVGFLLFAASVLFLVLVVAEEGR